MKGEFLLKLGRRRFLLQSCCDATRHASFPGQIRAGKELATRRRWPTRRVPLRRDVPWDKREVRRRFGSGSARRSRRDPVLLRAPGRRFPRPEVRVRKRRDCVEGGEHTADVKNGAAPALDWDICYRALSTRDARFDGRFYTAVLSTGVYCRPICPARTPNPKSCVFYPSAAAAQAAGFRPCLRCRPELSPGVAGWRGTANTVSRAISLIAEGALDDGGDVETLAARLGVSARHVRRLFHRHVGASPVLVAQTQRVLFAKRLIVETGLAMSEVALASGFGSVRRFNAIVRATFGRSPSALRRRSTGATAAAGITLALTHTIPYDWPAILGFLAARAVPGIEAVRAGAYERSIALDGACGMVTVRKAQDGRHLLATIRFPKVSALPTIVDRLRRMFDLDAEVGVIGSHLARDAWLAPLVAERPGLRVPGAWDAFELATRAVLGQQVSVAAARTLAARLVALHGVPPSCRKGECQEYRLFPQPADLSRADLVELGLPRARAAALQALAVAVAKEPNVLAPPGSLEATAKKLSELPGIGPWTAQYIAMRALREPDAFPAADLGLRRAAALGAERPSAAELLARAEKWRPWRAYAALHLWTHTGQASHGHDPDRSRILSRREDLAGV